MDRDQLAYTVTTNKDFARVVEDVKDNTQKHGFRVQAVHDVQKTLAEKGIAREPLTIIELCNARFASQVLERDVFIGLMMPCKINVYKEEGRTFISALRPTILAMFFPEARLEDVAAEVDALLKAIVDESR